MLAFVNRRAVVLLKAVGSVGLLMTANPGCLSDFDERSVQMDPADSLRVPGNHETGDGHVTTRGWLTGAHRQLSHLLPASSPVPLLTEDLTLDLRQRAKPGGCSAADPPLAASACHGLTNGNGQAIDVFSHFGVNPAGLQSLLKNFRGLRYSAQAASRDYHIDKPAPPWPGFEDLWIPIRLPIDDELSLSGRLGYARNPDGTIRDADCIVILPGLFGDHGVKRSADLAVPLRESGFHVLHLEVRGHGQTEARYPRMYHTFGVLETDDLMQVSDWLEALPHVRRTGLIAYCWNANIALLAAWYDGRTGDDGMISPALQPYLISANPQRRRFAAGVIAFSPVVRWQVLMDELDRERSRWGHPIFAAIQDTIRDRMKFKGHPEASGNLRRLVEYEYAGYGVPMPRGAREGYSFLRLVDYKDERAGDKLEAARTPVLIVHGADDPLVPAQDVADFVASVQNPKVAAMILPSGGHVGFAAFAPSYYLSLITSFFDPHTGPAGTPPDELIATSALAPAVTPAPLAGNAAQEPASENVSRRE